MSGGVKRSGYNAAERPRTRARFRLQSTVGELAQSCTQRPDATAPSSPLESLPLVLLHSVTSFLPLQTTARLGSSNAIVRASCLREPPRQWPVEFLLAYDRSFHRLRAWCRFPYRYHVVAMAIVEPPPDAAQYGLGAPGAAPPTLSAAMCRSDGMSAQIVRAIAACPQLQSVHVTIRTGCAPVCTLTAMRRWCAVVRAATSSCATLRCLAVLISTDDRALSFVDLHHLTRLLPGPSDWLVRCATDMHSVASAIVARSFTLRELGLPPLPFDVLEQCVLGCPELTFLGCYPTDTLWPVRTTDYDRMFPSDERFVAWCRVARTLCRLEEFGVCSSRSSRRSSVA